MAVERARGAPNGRDVEGAGATASITRGQAHLWIRKVSDVVEPTLPDPVLTVAEQDQWARFRRPTDRNLFHASRILQYQIGEQFLGHPVQIDRECARCGADHGRPGWRGAGDLDYSVSHSGNVVVMVVANGGRVGIDIEFRRPLQASSGWRGMAADVLTRAETAEIDAATDLSPAIAEREFVRLWCRKEAVVKLTGHGLLADLTTIDVRGDRVVVDDDGAGLWLQDLPLPPEYIGAVASTIPELIIHRS